MRKKQNNSKIKEFNSSSDSIKKKIQEKKLNNSKVNKPKDSDDKKLKIKKKNRIILK